jgi:hypothetical protein
MSEKDDKKYIQHLKFELSKKDKRIAELKAELATSCNRYTCRMYSSSLELAPTDTIKENENGS